MGVECEEADINLFLVTREIIFLSNVFLLSSHFFLFNHLLSSNVEMLFRFMCHEKRRWTLVKVIL